MKRTALLLVVLAPLLLAASCGVLPDEFCLPEDHAIDFAASDRVLRGTWSGLVPDRPVEGAETPLVLELDATWLASNEYAVSGTFALGDAAPLALEGDVFGACAETYVGGATLARASTDLAPAGPPGPARLRAEALDEAGNAVWSIWGAWGRHSGRPSLDEDTLEIDLGRADVEDPDIHDVVLRRVR